MAIGATSFGATIAEEITLHPPPIRLDRQIATLVVSVALVGLSGCGSPRKGSVDELKQRLEEMAQSQAEAKRRIEELNNRVFILEDKVDTSRVALESSGRPPQLPVIRLRPAETEDRAEARVDRGDRNTIRDPEDDPEGDLESEPEENPARSVVEEKRVRYSGAARAKDGPRPVLKLYGSSDTGSPAPARVVSAPIRGPEPSQVTEKLAVVPLPPRKVARKAAAGTGSVRHEYQSALDMYRSGSYTAAADAFRAFLKRYSRHDYADNALYWLGECFYDTKNFRLALTMFRRVVEEYPTGNKAPDALLKMGYSYLKLKENQNAKTVLAQLVESFPKSQVARLATETLVKIQ